MFVSSIFSAAGNDYFKTTPYSTSYSLSSKIFNGTRSLSVTTRSTSIPFPRESMIFFFTNHLMPPKFHYLYEGFGIPESIRTDDSLLIQAIVEVFYNYTIMDEDSVIATVKDEYERLYNLPLTRTLIDINTTENAMVAQVDFTCPITNQKLVKTIDGKTYTDYSIVKIFPDHLTPLEESVFTKFRKKPHDTNDISNLIAVSPSAAHDYFKTKDFEIFKILTELKEEAIRIEQMNNEMNAHDTEEKISVVIKSLVNIDIKNLSKLSYQALKVKDKIPPQEHGTLLLVRTYVRYYFNFLDEFLSLIESTYIGTSTRISGSIKYMSEILQKHGFTPPEIIDRLSGVLLEKTILPKTYLNYCKILVCYFVQHCEVLSDEVS